MFRPEAKADQPPGDMGKQRPAGNGLQECGRTRGLGRCLIRHGLILGLRLAAHHQLQFLRRLGWK